MNRLLGSGFIELALLLGVFALIGFFATLDSDDSPSRYTDPTYVDLVNDTNLDFWPGAQ